MRACRHETSGSGRQKVSCGSRPINAIIPEAGALIGEVRTCCRGCCAAGPATPGPDARTVKLRGCIGKYCGLPTCGGGRCPCGACPGACGGNPGTPRTICGGPCGAGGCC